MQKYFLLMAGDNYYPGPGTYNWIDTYSSYDEALSKVSIIDHKRVITKGNKKGQQELMYQSYKINDKNYDWFEIINLQDWIKL
jgi:hypothetical protein